MIQTTTRFAPLLALPLLAACASAPAIERLAVRPPAAASFQLAKGDNDQGAGAAAERALVATGWQVAATAPRWIVETSYTARPEAAGAFTSEATPKTPGEWLALPKRKAWWRRERAVRTLTLRFVDPATGREASRLSASTARDASLDDLAQAAVAPPA